MKRKSVLGVILLAAVGLAAVAGMAGELVPRAYFPAIFKRCLLGMGQIAYDSFVNGVSSTGEIYLTDLTGECRINLTNSPGSDFAPAGRRMDRRSPSIQNAMVTAKYI